MSRSGSAGRGKTAQVFISYAQRDQELAEAVSEELKGRGFRVWNKSQEISSGSPWSDAIGSALQESDSMIALLNARSFSSEYVRKELDFALFDERYKKRLLPVLVGDSTMDDFVQLPWILTKIEFLKLREAVPRNRAAKKIVDAFERLLARAGGRR